MTQLCLAENRLARKVRKVPGRNPGPRRVIRLKAFSTFLKETVSLDCVYQKREHTMNQLRTGMKTAANDERPTPLTNTANNPHPLTAGKLNLGFVGRTLLWLAMVSQLTW